MNIWLLQVGEPLPVNDKNSRLWRTGLLAKYLSKRGHKVTWWSSNFDHTKKRFVNINNYEVNKSVNFQMKFIESNGYKKNISIGRFIEHGLVAKEFKKKIKNEAKPDFIIASYPTIELCFEAVKYAKKNRIPVVVDIRDLWPDLFYEVAPKWMSWFITILTFNLRKKAKFIFRNSAALTANSPDAISWALNMVGKKVRNIDKYFPMGYENEKPNKNLYQKAEKFWYEKGISKNDFIICYAGAIGNTADFDLVIDVAERLKDITNIKFIICGKGDNFKKLIHKSNFLNNISFIGWVGYAEMRYLFKISSLGLVPYIKSFQFSGTPNKPIEYMSASLPIVTSLSNGLLVDLINDYNCGKSYDYDSDKLFNIIKRLYENDEELNQLSSNSYNLYLERFEAENVYTEMAKYLEEIKLKFNTYDKID